MQRIRARSWSLVSILLLLSLACSQVPLTFPLQSPPPTPQAQAAFKLPPVVVDFEPKRGAEVAPQQAALTLRFDRAMDKASVENALQIRPPVEGEMSWPDAQTLVFRPQGLALATRYRVSLGEGVRAADGMTMTQGVEFSFQTVEPLAVTTHTPADQAEDVRVDAPLLLTFNYPIVPINCTGQEAGRVEGCPLLDLSTDPPTQLRGFWVDTASYRADPVPGWQAGQHYLVTLAPTAALNGAQMEAPLTWSFATAQPRLLSVEPQPYAEAVPLETGIRLTFNTPMDEAATAGAFSLVGEDGVQVAGTIVWEDDGAQMIFTPTQHLALDTTYFIHLSTRARALTGAPIAEPFEGEFRTVPPPRLVELQPADGERGVELYRSVVLVFAGRIDPQTVMAHVTLTPPPDEDDLYTSWSGNAFHISWPMEPRTRYCVEVEPGIADTYGNLIEEGASTCFTTGDEPPLFAPLGEAQGDFVTLDAAEAPVLYAVQRNVPAIELTLRSVPGIVGTGEPIRTWTERFDAPPNRITAEAIHLSRRDHPLPTGYYRLTWEEGGWERSLLVAVIDRHLTLKLSTEEALAWVTDLHTGEPIAGAEVRLLGQKGNLLAGGTTDAQGLVRIPISGVDSLWDIFGAETGTPGEAGFGAAINGVLGGLGPWRFDLRYETWKPSPYRAYLYADRPIYRPGQTVRWRLIVRENRDLHYSLPPLGEPVELELYDCEGGDPIATQPVALSDMGTADGSFTLSEEAVPCPYYRIVPTIGGQRLDEDGLSFAVAAYRKPAFQVEVRPQQDDLLNGEVLRADLAASYYFGGAVSDASVHWRIVRLGTPVPFPLGGGWGTQPSALPWQTETPVAEGDGRTDAEGHFLVEWQAALTEPKDGSPPSGERFRIEATVTDTGGFPVGGEATVNVHPARLEVGIRATQQVAVAGEKTPVEVRAVDWYGAPVAHQPLRVTLAKRQWYRLAEPTPFGPSWGYTDTVIADFDVQTDAQGQAEAFVTPPSAGPYVVAVEGEDEAGNLARAETFLWVSGAEGAAWQQSDGVVEPVADAESYLPGETARILLPTPFTSTYRVLMTVERGSILDVQQFITSTANPILSLPIEPTYAPNVFVSFVAVCTQTGGAPQAVLGTVEVDVEPVLQRLKVELRPDRAEYEPGETAEVQVAVYDADGNPVDAEIGLAAVDKAVLALAEEQSPSIEAAFYGKQPLRIVSGDSLTTLADRWSHRFRELQKEAEVVAMEMMAGGIGGGGGGEGQPELRHEFPDTAFWEAHLRTGTQGEVQVSIPLPDSLTTWVIDGRAVTADTKVGQATVEIVATKPFFIRPLTPRFFVAGDESEVGAIVHNNTDHRLSVEVSLTAEGAQLHSEGTQSLTLPAGGRARLDWRIAVPEAGSDAVLLTFEGQGGGYSDRVRPTVGTADEEGALPVLRYHSPDVTGTGGAMATEGARLEAIVVPPQAGESTHLDVVVAPSLVAEMAAQLRAHEREALPESTEAIVSGFLPDAYLYLALTQAQVADPALAEELPPLVERSLKRLYARQHADGGWGWVEEESNLQLSAYVVLGMLTAKAAGLNVEQASLDAGLRYLEAQLEQHAAQAESRPLTVEDALAFYVLTLGGRPWPSGLASALYDGRETVGTTGRAYLTLAFGMADPADRRVSALIDRLRSEAVSSANGTHWEEDNPLRWCTDIRATAAVIKALVRYAPDDPLLPDAVRWLMVARSGRPWMTAQEIAWETMAFLDYALTTHELEGDYSWGLSLNGHAVASGNVSPETVRQTTPVRLGLADDPAEGLVRDRPNALEIARGKGPGVLYYTADFTLDRPAEQVEPTSRGLSVERLYCDPFRSDEEHCVRPEEIHTGDLVEVRLKVTVPAQRYFVELTDFYPSGMEPVDPSLLTEQAEMPDEVPPHWWFWGGFDAPRLLDDHATFVARQLSAGSYEVRYLLRATFYGRYRVLPALVREHYFPEVWGRTAGTTLTILP